MNKVTLIGNVGKDPELRTIGDNQVVSFSLATTRRFKDKDGNKVTDWHSVQAWGKTAELIAQYVHKGDRLAVEGEIQYREYEKDGVKRQAVNINCNEVEFLSGRKDDAPAIHPASNITETRQEPDLPF
jgi:single-strand DNA-binding protein